MHRILVIGTGSIGERHVRCMLATGRATVGICDSNDSLRRTVADRYSVQENFAALDEAIRHDWDAAVVATPANLHVPMALELMKKNIAAFIEKPLSTGMDGIGKLVQENEDRKLNSAVAYVFRAHPGMRAMKKAIESGEFGKPVQIIMVSGQNFPTYRPAYREIYYTKRVLYQ